MQRYSKTYFIEDTKHIKDKLLQWVQQFREVVFLNNNSHQAKYSSHEAILAFDAFTLIQTDTFKAFDTLKQYQFQTKDWLFGYLSYDLKNDIENLNSENRNELGFADLFFFQPKKIIFVADNHLRFEYLGMCEDEIEEDFKTILNVALLKNGFEKKNQVKSRVSFNEYENGFNKVMQHIQRGDIYEANYCIEFYVENICLNAVDVYTDLNKISEPPFACFVKLNRNYVLCASPERYLKKTGNKIITQPIKGTAKRGNSEAEDLALKTNLSNNEKEKSENVMIVDLVRNDLSKTAVKGSVMVEELFGIYTFKQVHQMISTVVSEVAPNENPVDIIKSTFPMGSMTGAPKLSAMKIIEEVEQSKRGVYSGAVGYFTPANDFDFNVVIRSIFYNEDKAYASFSVGSAITINANATDEYNECLLKANAMQKVLENVTRI